MSLVPVFAIHLMGCLASDLAFSTAASISLYSLWCYVMLSATVLCSLVSRRLVLTLSCIGFHCCVNRTTPQNQGHISLG